MSKIKIHGQPILVDGGCVICVIEMESLVNLHQEYGQVLYSPNIRGSLIINKTNSEKQKMKVFRSMTKTLSKLSKEKSPRPSEFISRNKGVLLLTDKFEHIGDGFYDVGDLTSKYRGISDGCQTSSNLADFVKKYGFLPKNQKVSVKINVGLTEEEAKELTKTNNCHNSVSEKDILLAFSNELEQSVYNHSVGKYTLKTKKGGSVNKNENTKVIDLTKLGRTNTMLSYFLEKPELNGSVPFIKYKDEIYAKATGEGIINMFNLEQNVIRLFKLTEKRQRYNNRTKGYIKWPTITAIKQLTDRLGEINLDSVVNEAILVIDELLNGEDIDGWIQKKANCLLFCEKLKVNVLLKHKTNV